MMKTFSLFLTALLSLNLAGYPPAMLTPEFLSFLGNDQVLADKMNPNRQVAIENYLGGRYVYIIEKKTEDGYNHVVYSLTGEDDATVKAGFYGRFPRDYDLVFIDYTLSERQSLEKLFESIDESRQEREHHPASNGPIFFPRIEILLKRVVVQLDPFNDETIAWFKATVSDDKRLVFEDIPIADGGLYPEDYGDVEEATPDDSLAAE